MLKSKLVGIIILILLIGGCQSRPSTRYELGNLLLDEDFSAAFDWDERTSGAVEIGIADDAYRIRADVNQYVRGFNATTYENIVIEVETLQRTADEDNAYGVVCRASAGEDNASGYYFLIGGDGSYSIRKGRDDIDALVSWARSDVINRGAGSNTIRAVCMGDYLALYVNGEFIADAHDNTYRGGFVGFVAAAAEGTIVEIAFDNLRIWEATAK